jgi:Phosphotransferase enzyme family
MTSEEPLTGGNVSSSVTRVGGTVRKPWTPATPAVHAFMAHVRARGVDVPATLGRDEHGRQVLEHVPGMLALDAAPLDEDGLARVGAYVRAIHDAAAGFAVAPGSVWSSAIPAPAAELVCHNDLAPWNLVLGERWVFIDWDASAPSTRLWDLAYAAQAFTLDDPDLSPDVSAARLAVFVEGYGADDTLRAALPHAMRDRTAAMVRLLRESHEKGVEPWGTMHVAGHGDHWSRALDYVAAHLDVWRSTLARS